MTPAALWRIEISESEAAWCIRPSGCGAAVLKERAIAFIAKAFTSLGWQPAQRLSCARSGK
jgi:hypothetical protein